MNIDKTYEKLAFEIDCKNIEFDVSMKEYTSFKAGGAAKALAKPNNVEELANLLKVLHKNKINHLVIGNGSNILVKDDGYNGVIVKLSVYHFIFLVYWKRIENKRQKLQEVI